MSEATQVRSGVRALSDAEVAALIAKFEADGNQQAADSLRSITTKKLFGSKATVNWRDPETDPNV
jgi:hypothetical protein